MHHEECKLGNGLRPNRELQQLELMSIHLHVFKAMVADHLKHELGSTDAVIEHRCLILGAGHKSWSKLQATKKWLQLLSTSEHCLVSVLGLGPWPKA